MPIQTSGDAPGPTAEPAAGVRVTLYRFELMGGALVRKSPRDVQPRVDGSRFLIDVLLNEDKFGRYISGVRGFIVPQQGDVTSDRPPFKVSAEHMQAIGEALDVGPHMQLPPRPVMMDGWQAG